MRHLVIRYANSQQLDLKDTTEPFCNILVLQLDLQEVLK